MLSKNKAHFNDTISLIDYIEFFIMRIWFGMETVSQYFEVLIVHTMHVYIVFILFKQSPSTQERTPT